MNGFEAIERHGSLAIYTIARKHTTLRLRARDLIPPAVMYRGDRLQMATSPDVPTIPVVVAPGMPPGGYFIGLVDEYVAMERAAEMRKRVAKWWDDYAGPLIRRLQAAMYVKLQAHVARRSMWNNSGPVRLVVDGQATDFYTGERVN